MKRWVSGGRGAGAVVAQVVGLVVALLSFAFPAGGQSSDLDALARDAAAAINGNTKDLNGKAQVLIQSFQVTNRGVPYLELGVRVADAFEASLRKTKNDFTVLDRDGTFSKKVAAEGNENACRKGPPAANVTVEGEIAVRPGEEVDLTVRAFRDKKAIYERSLTVSRVPEVFGPEVDPGSLPPVLQGRIAWVRAEPEEGEREQPIRMRKGDEKLYKLPTCIRCPQPQYSDAAVKARLQGILLLDVEVSAEGRATAIGVIRPLACGLTPKAVDAVRGWKFSPATGPDGKPVAMLVPVEVAFRLY